MVGKQFTKQTVNFHFSKPDRRPETLTVRIGHIAEVQGSATVVHCMSHQVRLLQFATVEMKIKDHVTAFVYPIDDVLFYRYLYTDL